MAVGSFMVAEACGGSVFDSVGVVLDPAGRAGTNRLRGSFTRPRCCGRVAVCRGILEDSLISDSDYVGIWQWSRYVIHNVIIT